MRFSITRSVGGRVSAAILLLGMATAPTMQASSGGLHMKRVVRQVATRMHNHLSSARNWGAKATCVMSSVCVIGFTAQGALANSDTSSELGGGDSVSAGGEATMDEGGLVFSHWASKGIYNVNGMNFGTFRLGVEGVTSRSMQSAISSINRRISGISIIWVSGP